ncbi:hypothetical protein ABZ479_14160 [Streptomyces sp. NPDC005722]
MIVVQPVLETGTTDGFTLWPVAEWEPFTFMPLHAGLSAAEMGAAVAAQRVFAPREVTSAARAARRGGPGAGGGPHPPALPQPSAGRRTPPHPLPR